MIVCACLVSGDAPRKLERYLDEALFAIDWWKQRGRLPEWVSEGTPDLKLHKDQALIACVKSSRRKRLARLLVTLPPRMRWCD